jgi:hypothetical protein
MQLQSLLVTGLIEKHDNCLDRYSFATISLWNNPINNYCHDSCI